MPHHLVGTSIGAFVGGLYAREGDLITTSARAKQFSGRMGNIWRMLSDVTYPIVAYTTGHEFNRTIWKVLSQSITVLFAYLDFTRLSMTYILKICGCHFFVIPQISSRLEWKYTKQDMRGDTFVGNFTFRLLLPQNYPKVPP